MPNARCQTHQTTERQQVPDVDQDLFESATRALLAQRQAYQSYLQIVDAQRAALQADDMRLMRGLADQLDGIIADIEDQGKNVVPIQRLFSGGQVDGIRAQEIRDLMTAVAADAASAQASVRELTRRLVQGSDEARRELLSLEDDSTPNSAAGALDTPQPRLIDTRR